MVRFQTSILLTSIAGLAFLRITSGFSTISQSSTLFHAKAFSNKREIGYSPKSRRVSLSMWSSDDEIQGADRIKSCIPYMLPLIDGDHFGRFIYNSIPPLGAIDDFVLGPFVTLNRQVPFLSLILFTAFTLGTRFNMDMNRNVRFNAQQAALIDLALIFPELIGSSFAEEPLPRALVASSMNFVWIAYVSLVVYSIYSNLRGKRPDQIPFISNGADLMVGPF